MLSRADMIRTGPVLNFLEISTKRKILMSIRGNERGIPSKEIRKEVSQLNPNVKSKESIKEVKVNAFCSVEKKSPKVIRRSNRTSPTSNESENVVMSATENGMNAGALARRESGTMEAKLAVSLASAAVQNPIFQKIILKTSIPTRLET